MTACILSINRKLLNKSNTFKSTNNGKVYKIRQRLSCHSYWLIYLATYKRYKCQYVGKRKTMFKLGHSDHTQEIKRWVGGLDHHYGGSGHCTYQDLSITLIEHVEDKSFEFLAQRELYWHQQLRVYITNGSKTHCYGKDLKS